MCARQKSMYLVLRLQPQRSECSQGLHIISYALCEPSDGFLGQSAHEHGYLRLLVAQFAPTLPSTWEGRLGPG